MSSLPLIARPLGVAREGAWRALSHPQRDLNRILREARYAATVCCREWNAKVTRAMLDLVDLMVFTKIVETESLTKAGQLLGLPKSTVSRRVSRLEGYLGVQLLHRSSRAVTVTQDGAVFFEYCMRSIGVLRDGERALQNQQRTPQGVVKIALP